MATTVPPFRRRPGQPDRGFSKRRSPTRRPAAPKRSAKPPAQAARQRLNQRRAFQSGLTQQQPEARPSRFRLLLVWVVLLLGSLGLTLNLFRLQVIDADLLQERALAQQIADIRPLVPRRPIVDRNGNVLALDKPAYTLYAHPLMFKVAKDAIATALAPILEKTTNDLLALMSQGETGIPITHGLSEDVANRITNLRLDGLELERQQHRIYPQQNLMAEVVGYVSLDREGQSGVEYSLAEQLERPVAGVSVRRTGSGDILPDGLPSSFIQQDDLRLRLTVDSRLQRTARFALQQQLEKYSAKRGTVIVMDVQDGSILALVCDPSYDPNRYYEANVDLFRNWTVSDLYEPGSTFKPINVAIALEAGVIQPNDTFYDEGRIEVGGWPIQNSDYDYEGGRGTISIEEILQYSSNVGMVRIIQRMKPAEYYDWLKRIDLGEPSNVDLPFEVTPQIKDREEFVRASIEPATTAFGQGFSLTPLKLIQLEAMLANGGKLVTPHVVQGLFDANGQNHLQTSLPSRQVFSPQTTQQVLSMMETAVTEGTGTAAQIPGYRIAGKTGTAQKASEYGGYDASARITSFIGLFPVEAPRYAVLTVVDEPKGEDAYGSTVAAPVTRSVIEALIAIEGILPSQPVTADRPSADNEAEWESFDAQPSALDSLEESQEEPAPLDEMDAEAEFLEQAPE